MVTGDMEPTPLQGQPGWALDGSTCNTWLFVNDGKQAIDYANGHEHWTSDAFDFQKNIWVWTDENGDKHNLMNKSQRDFLGRQNEFAQMTMVGSDGLNPGRCQDGADNMVGGCASIVEVSSAMPFFGFWDIESALNLYTGDNKMQYDYSLYCRWEEPASHHVGMGICQRNDDWTAQDKPAGAADWGLHAGLGFRSCDVALQSVEACRAVCENMDGCNMFAGGDSWDACCFPFRSTNLAECNPSDTYRDRYNIHRLN